MGHLGAFFGPSWGSLGALLGPSWEASWAIWWHFLVSRTSWYLLLRGISRRSGYLVLLGISHLLVSRTSRYLVPLGISHVLVSRTSWYLARPGISYFLISPLVLCSTICGSYHPGFHRIVTYICHSVRGTVTNYGQYGDIFIATQLRTKSS